MQNYIAMSSSLNIYRLSLHCSAFPGGVAKRRRGIE